MGILEIGIFPIFLKKWVYRNGYINIPIFANGYINLNIPKNWKYTQKKTNARAAGNLGF